MPNMWVSKGKKLTEETKAKLSQSKKGNKSLTGRHWYNKCSSI